MLTADVATLRQLEKTAVTAGTPEYLLMCRAGILSAAFLKQEFPRANRWVILCGGGNNGGDALVAARYLDRDKVVIYSTVEKEKFTGCAANAVRDLPEEIPFFCRKTLGKNDFQSGDVIVDGLLGIGFHGRSLREEAANFIHAANCSCLPVAALDLPSGLDGDTGRAADNAVIKAACTLTYGAPKAGLFKLDGPICRGKLRVLDIGLAPSPAGMEVFTNIDAVNAIPVPAADCHKNSRGRVLVWGSSPEYPGAAALAVAGALKGGAGIVRCVSEADLHDRLYNAAIFRQLRSGEVPEEFMQQSDVLVCGCGWGQCASESSIRAVLEFPGKVVLDADALNFIARNLHCWKPRKDLVITPHPGEAGRLLSALGVKDKPDRREMVKVLADKLQTAVLLKGQDSLVAEPGREPVLIASGSPVLAAAGSGDVLAGVIGALAAQAMDIAAAAELGAYIHGLAGESAGAYPVADEFPDLISKMIFKLRYNEII